MSFTTITPDEARAQLKWLAGCNEVGTADQRRELTAILKAADEVEETDPAKMIGMAEALERWAQSAEDAGRQWQADEDRKAAARYRRCAARASTANDNAQLDEAA